MTVGQRGRQMFAAIDCICGGRALFGPGRETFLCPSCSFEISMEAIQLWGSVRVAIEMQVLEDALAENDG